MSAYDNPTIIKDDSAMAWANAFSGLGKSMMESFEEGRKERDAKYKEAKLDAEKKAKEDKEQTIANQVAISEENYKLQTRISKNNEGLEKIGGGPGAVELANNYSVSTGTKAAEYSFDIKTKALSPEEFKEKNTYITKQLEGEANLNNALGGLYSGASAFLKGEINPTNIGNYVFRGRNALDQTVNRLTTFALAYPDDAKTTKELEYNDPKDPSKITLYVKTKVGDINALKDAFIATNPGAKDKIDENIQNGIKDGSIIATGDAGKEQYTINFKRDINPNFDGSLYVKVPEVNYGKAPVTAGVYSDENGKEITNQYIGVAEYGKIEGNANLSKGQGTAVYERIPVDMDKIMTAMTPILQSQAQAIVATDFDDNDTGNAVLQKLGFGTNFPLENFSKLNTTEKVNLLVEKMAEKEKANIIANSSLEPIYDEETGKTNYYIMDAKNAKIFKDASTKKTKGGGKTGASKETWEEKEAAIKSVASVSGTHRWGSNSIYTDGEGNWYEDKNMYVPLKSQELALAYLKTGKKSSKK